MFLAFPLNHQKSAWESSLLRYVEDFVDSGFTSSLLCFVFCVTTIAVAGAVAICFRLFYDDNEIIFMICLQ